MYLDLRISGLGVFSIFVGFLSRAYKTGEEICFGNVLNLKYLHKNYYVYNQDICLPKPECLFQFAHECAKGSYDKGKGI